MTTSPEIQWLLDYQGNFPFYLSLRQQFEARGTLSEKQMDALARAVTREQRPVSVDRAPAVETFTLKAGDGLEIRAWLARSIAAEFNHELAFRNLRVTEVLRETAMAWQVRFRDVSKTCNNCHLCGKELDTEISRACGVGPTCAKKLGFKRVTMADAGKILEAMEAAASSIGELGPRWLPKSQACGRFV